MEAYFADVVLSAHIQDALARVRLPQYADLIFRRVSLAFHVSGFCVPDYHFTRLKKRGHVNNTPLHTNPQLEELHSVPISPFCPTMNWHYSHEGKQIGPIGEAEFEASVKSGVINGDTLVWKEGFPQWIKYSEVSQSAVGGGVALSTLAHCSECRREFAQDEMVKFAGAWVCAECKPQYVQKLKEGVKTGSRATLWRSGKRLVMPMDATLPHRCVKCNDPVDAKQINRKLYWHHPAVYLTLFVNVLVYIIVAMCCRKHAATSVSLCSKHRATRRNAILVSWLLILGGIAAFIGGVIYESVAGIIGGIIVFLGAIIYGIVRGRLVYATKITKEHVWLGGCKRAFLAEFPEWTGVK